MNWLIVMAIFFGVISLCAFLADNVLWRIPAFNKLVEWLVKSNREG